MTAASSIQTSTPPPAAEPEEARAARLARERAMVEEARAELRAGRGVALAEFEVWIDKLIAGDDPPLPGSTAP